MPIKVRPKNPKKPIKKGVLTIKPNPRPKPSRIVKRKANI